MSYCPNTPEEQQQMLAAIGVKSIADLFEPIPQKLRAASFNLPPGMSEFEMIDRMKALAEQNGPGLLHFIGGGAYDHIIPTAVDHLANRAEFYTAYTPYQPECSQGSLQALFEYQTAICRLTGMEVSNASLYDGGTALAEAALMALRITGRRRLLVDGCINPFYRQILATYMANLDVELVTIQPLETALDRAAFLKALDDQCAALLFQTPNFFGTIEDLTELSAAAHNKGALLVAATYPVALGLVKTPAAMGADITAGDGQSLGNPLSFGGPAFGYIATTKKYIRNLPGRIIGETVDKEGRRGFVLTLQAREQHIKRHKATSNICSNQSLCALRGLIFLSLLGKSGLVELAQLNRDKAEYAKELLTGISGVSVQNSGATFNEFVIRLPKPADEIVKRLLSKGIAAGIPLAEHYIGMDNSLLITVTEKRSKAEIERLAKAIEKELDSFQF
jgi:glycine dehydrogenase subunit 1